jgi:SAM-dependent methyltransferase
MRITRRLLALSFLLFVALGVAYLGLADRGIERALNALPPGVSAALGVPTVQLNTCPVCLQSSTFVPMGPSRLRAACPACGSLERHRLLYLYLRQKTNLFTAPLSVLHFSPEPGLGAALAGQKNLTYATSWYEPERQADLHLDLTNLALPDASWDVLICNHVFEHIPDDRRAMREMYRVLKPGGWAVVSVPVREQPETLEDPAVDTPEERVERFGRFDHVRSYGWKDFADRLTEAGFEVTIERFGQGLSDSAVKEFALSRNELIYLIRKR